MRSSNIVEKEIFVRKLFGITFTNNTKVRLLYILAIMRVDSFCFKKPTLLYLSITY